MCDDTAKSSPVLSWKILEVPGRVWTLSGLFRAPWRSILNPSHAPIDLIHQAAEAGTLWSFLIFSDFWTGSERKMWMCLSPFPWNRVGGQIWLWILILNFRPVCCACNVKSILFNKKVELLLFQLLYPWFNLNHISLTKNLSKAKNFKNHCYGRSKNLHCKEVPKWSIPIADLFVSLDFLVQQWVNFHTHTKRSFVFPSMCESYGILLEKKKKHIFSSKV